MAQLPCIGLSWPLTNRHLLGVAPSTFTKCLALNMTRKAALGMVQGQLQIQSVVDVAENRQVPGAFEKHFLCKVMGAQMPRNNK